MDLKEITESNEPWAKWLRQQSTQDQLDLGAHAISRLIEIGEIGFRVDDCVRLDGSEIGEDEVVDEYLYWTSSKLDILGTAWT